MLGEARRLGFLGPGPIEAHLDHADGFAESIRRGWPDADVRSAADLGSGGGVPGIPLALAFADVAWTLVDAAVRRAAFLREAVATLGLSGQVTVVEMRAEELGRLPQYRRGYQLVVARGFGPAGVTAECAASLLATGGRAVISEPPGGRPERWPTKGLTLLGMSPGSAVQTTGGSFQVLIQDSPCPDRYPRRIPAKRPLF